MGCAVSFCLHVRGGGWCCGTAWLPANPALWPLSGAGGGFWQTKVAVTCSGEEAPTPPIIHRSGKMPGTCLVPPAPTQCGLSHAGGHRALAGELSLTQQSLGCRLCSLSVLPSGASLLHLLPLPTALPHSHPDRHALESSRCYFP